MSQADLQATRDQFAAQQRDIARDKTIKEERAVSRLESQAGAASGLAVLEAELAHAESTLAFMTSNAAPEALLDEQQEVVDAAQRAVDGYGSSASFITDPDAQEIQFELDVLDYSVTRLGELITQIDALLP
jgi:hypothetical protein